VVVAFGHPLPFMFFFYSLALLAHFQYDVLYGISIFANGHSASTMPLCVAVFAPCGLLLPRVFPLPLIPLLYLPVGCRSLHSPCGLFVGTPPQYFPCLAPVFSLLSLSFGLFFALSVVYCLCPPPFDSAFRSRCRSRAFGHFL
jgi:hypothetical protein